MAAQAPEDLRAEGFPTGPGLGEVMPDFELPDQQGRPVRFAEWRGDGQALIIFYRSASW